MTLRFSPLRKSALGRCVRDSRAGSGFWQGSSLTFEVQNRTYKQVMWLHKQKLVYLSCGRAIANEAGRRAYAGLIGEPVAKVGLGAPL